MKLRISHQQLCAIAFFALTSFVTESSAQPALATGADAEITADGLHRVDTDIMNAAWVQPDLDLSGYSKVYLMPARVQFREVDPVSSINRIRSSINAFPVTEERRSQFNELWGQLLYDDVAKMEDFELVNEVGRDVLIIRAELVDVISGTPPDNLPISSGSTVAYPWAATIVLEVRDAMSDELLARTADRRRAEGQLDATAVWARTPQIIGRWSMMICDHLVELRAL